MGRVFVSHASGDRAPTALSHRWLRDAGHEVFLDEHGQDGIAPGEDWEQRLYTGLRWADAVVCVVTSAYCRSAWCTAEVVIARSQGARLLPIVAEPGVQHPLLRSVQNIDMTTDGPAARERLLAALREIDAGGGLGWPDDLSPFPGLAPFTSDRHRAFFGREEDVRHLTALLRTPVERTEGSVVVVVGPSGCGKSSLVRAGLVPAVAAEPDARALAPCRPGRDPVGAVVAEFAAGAQALGRPWRSVSDLRAQGLAGGLPDLVTDLLMGVAGDRRDRLLLVVDQFEELLTQADAHARADFVRLISPALRRSLQVVVTLRPEFLDGLLANPELAGLSTRVYPVAPLRRDDLATVIERPARLAGMRVDEGLVEALVADTAGGDALPLLAYTLERLARASASDGVYRNGLLSRRRYVELRGVGGALAGQADDALEAARAAGGRDAGAVIRELLRLVVVDDHGRPTRWRTPWGELSGTAARELDAFVGRRLLTTGTSPDGHVVVEVAHEAFLTAWPPLATAIEQESTALRTRRRVEQATGDWTAGGRGAGGLWGGDQLAGAVADLGAQARRPGPGSRASLYTDRVELSRDAQAFLLAGIARDRRRRRRATAVLSVLLLLAVAAGTVALLQARATGTAQRLAVARQLLAQADLVRPADSRTALLLGLAAADLSPDRAATANLVDTMSHTRYARTLRHTTGVVAIAFAPGGSTLVTGGMDGHATVWDLADPRGPARLGADLPVQRGYVYDVTFSPDGRTLAAAGADGTVELWDMTDRTAPRRTGAPLGGHAAAVHAVAFSPDGRTLASVGFDGRMILRDVSDTTRPTVTASVTTGHLGDVFDVAFAPDGRAVATAGADGSVRLWSVTDRSRPAPLGPPLTGMTNAVWSTAFAPGGAVVSAVDQSGELATWATDGSARLLGPPVRVHTGAAYDLAYSPDGTLLATAGAEGEAGLFSATDPARPVRVGEPLRAHADQVYAVAFAPGGRSLASAGADGTAVLWDLTGPPQPVLRSTVAGPGGTSAAAATPSGRMLATGGSDRAVRFWDVADPARPRPAGAPIVLPGEVSALAVSPDSRTLVAGTTAGSMTTIGLEGPGPPRVLGAAAAVRGAVHGVAFAPVGTTVAIAGEDGAVSLWDTADPARPVPVGVPGIAHTGPVYGVAFSADGGRLASVGADGAVLEWIVRGADADSSDGPDRRGPRPVRPGLIGGGAPVYAVAGAADGRTLAGGGKGGAVSIWDLSASGAPRRTPPSATSGDGEDLYAVTFTGDGATLAAAGSSGAVRFWDVTDPYRPRTTGSATAAAAAPVVALAAPRGTPWLAAAHADGAIGLWDLSALDDLRAHAVERACAITGRGLDPGPWTTFVPDLDYEDSCR